MDNKPNEKEERISNNLKRSKNQIKELIVSKTHRRAGIILVIVALSAGWLVSSVMQGPKTSVKKTAGHVHGSEEQATVWTCSMHPQIQLPKPGQCPLCGMDLIPIKSYEAEGMPSARRLVMSPEAVKLAEIATTAVERKFVSTEIRMVGKVEYDETKIAYITAWAGGRIDRLYIDQTGVPVKKGDHLAYLYSPELLAAQEEYLQAIEGSQNVRESHLDIIKTTSEDTIRNSREKLKLLGITEQQIADLEARKVPSDHMTIYATASGIVVSREVQEGTYVQTGSRIYSIVDLSEVWIKLDAYEKDLLWLRYGQDVEFEAEAYPGKTLHGRISFIAPVLDQTTRTVKVRVNVRNDGGELKPGMFVRAKVSAHVAGMGRVMAPDLEGKWMCPMHPEVIQDIAGNCPICEMPLVPTETMGYTTAREDDAPLVIPVTAVLKTGKRAVVYVQDETAVRPTFEGREIVLGPRAGEHYLIYSGLSEGERVVVNGNFKIDSALQIKAKPSMMNPEGGAGGGGHDMSKMGGGSDANKADKEMPMPHVMAPQAFLTQLEPVYKAYFEFQTILATDDFDQAKAALQGLRQALKPMDMTLLKDKLHASWMELSRGIENSLVIGLEAKSIDVLRQDVLDTLSGQVISLERIFGHSGNGAHFKVYCPMALSGKGAVWLQPQEAIQNPYFGKAMPRCGKIQATFATRGGMDAKTDGGAAHVH